MAMYALERRGRRFVLAFAGGCVLSSSYGFLAGTWPFGIIEAIWAAVAVKRFVELRPPAADSEPPFSATMASKASTRRRSAGAADSP